MEHTELVDSLINNVISKSPFFSERDLLQAVYISEAENHLTANSSNMSITLAEILRVIDQVDIISYIETGNAVTKLYLSSIMLYSQNAMRIDSTVMIVFLDTSKVLVKNFDVLNLYMVGDYMLKKVFNNISSWEKIFTLDRKSEIDSLVLFRFGNDFEYGLSVSKNAAMNPNWINSIRGQSRIFNNSALIIYLSRFGSEDDFSIIDSFLNWNYRNDRLACLEVIVAYEFRSIEFLNYVTTYIEDICAGGTATWYETQLFFRSLLAFQTPESKEVIFTSIQYSTKSKCRRCLQILKDELKKLDSNYFNDVREVLVNN